MRKAEIKMHDLTAGWLTLDENGYHFVYDAEYLQNDKVTPISLTLPLRTTAYTSKVMFPFFDGLIPEGWLLEIAEKNWKLRPKDRMGLLLACCRDCVGAVSVYPVNVEVK
ncbi:MAG: HipA N-terminal domain-containing protein [Saprospiraceae bacterium]